MAKTHFYNRNAIKLSMPVIKEASDSLGIKDSLTSNAARSGWSMLAAKVLRHGTAGITYFLLANILEPSDFGILKMVTVVLSAVNLLNDLGLTAAVVQQKELDTAALGASVLVSLLSGILLYAAVYISAPFLSIYFREPNITALLRIGALSVPLSALSSVHRGVLQRKLHFGRLAIAEVSGAVVSSGLAVILAFSGFGVWALIVQVLCQSAITSLIIILFRNNLLSGMLQFKQAWPLIVFGVSVIIPRLVDYAGQTFDTWVIGRLFGSAQLGFFSVAFTFVTIPMAFFGAVLMQIILSVFSRIQHDMKAINHNFINLSQAIAFSSAPFFCALYVFTPEITFILDSRRISEPVWQQSTALIRLLAPMGFIYTVSSFYLVTWLAMGMMKERMALVAVNTLTLIISVFTGAIFGVAGVCVALSVRAVVIWLLMITITGRKTGLERGKYFKKILSITAILICMVPVGFSIRYAGNLWMQKYFIIGPSAGIIMLVMLHFTAMRIFLPGTFRDVYDYTARYLIPLRRTRLNESKNNA